MSSNLKVTSLTASLTAEITSNLSSTTNLVSHSVPSSPTNSSSILLSTEVTTHCSDNLDEPERHPNNQSDSPDAPGPSNRQISGSNDVNAYTIQADQNCSNIVSSQVPRKPRKRKATTNLQTDTRYSPIASAATDRSSRPPRFPRKTQKCKAGSDVATAAHKISDTDQYSEVSRLPRKPRKRKAENEAPPVIRDVYDFIHSLRTVQPTRIAKKARVETAPPKPSSFEIKSRFSNYGTRFAAFVGDRIEISYDAEMLSKNLIFNKGRCRFALAVVVHEKEAEQLESVKEYLNAGGDPSIDEILTHLQCYGLNFDYRGMLCAELSAPGVVNLLRQTKNSNIGKAPLKRIGVYELLPPTPPDSGQSFDSFNSVQSSQSVLPSESVLSSQSLSVEIVQPQKMSDLEASSILSSIGAPPKSREHMNDSEACSILLSLGVPAVGQASRCCTSQGEHMSDLEASSILLSLGAPTVDVDSTIDIPVNDDSEVDEMEGAASILLGFKMPDTGNAKSKETDLVEIIRTDSVKSTDPLNGCLEDSDIERAASILLGLKDSHSRLYNTEIVDDAGADQISDIVAYGVAFAEIILNEFLAANPEFNFRAIVDTEDEETDSDEESQSILSILAGERFPPKRKREVDWSRLNYQKGSFHSEVCRHLADSSKELAEYSGAVEENFESSTVEGVTASVKPTCRVLDPDREPQPETIDCEPVIKKQKIRRAPTSRAPPKVRAIKAPHIAIPKTPRTSKTLTVVQIPTIAQTPAIAHTPKFAKISIKRPIKQEITTIGSTVVLPATNSAIRKGREGLKHGSYLKCLSRHSPYGTRFAAQMPDGQTQESFLAGGLAERIKVNGKPAELVVVLHTGEIKQLESSWEYLISHQAGGRVTASDILGNLKRFDLDNNHRKPGCKFEKKDSGNFLKRVEEFGRRRGEDSAYLAL